MAKIYKHELRIGLQVRVECGPVLSVIEQDGNIMLYAIDSPTHNQPHFFYVVGTGWDLDEVSNMRFLATVKVGALVFHVFYRGKGV